MRHDQAVRKRHFRDCPPPPVVLQPSQKDSNVGENRIRTVAVAAILELLARHPGTNWYSIDRALSGCMDVGPYTAELDYLTQCGKVRRDGHCYWLVDDPPATQSDPR